MRYINLRTFTFLNYCVHKFGNARTVERTDARRLHTDGQSDNVVPRLPGWPGGTIKILDFY